MGALVMCQNSGNPMIRLGAYAGVKNVARYWPGYVVRLTCSHVVRIEPDQLHYAMFRRPDASHMAYCAICTLDREP